MVAANQNGEETFIRGFGPSARWEITGRFKLFGQVDEALAHIREHQRKGNIVCMIRPVINGEAGGSQDFDTRYSDDGFREWCQSLDDMVREEYPLEQWASTLIEVETYIEPHNR